VKRVRRQKRVTSHQLHPSFFPQEYESRLSDHHYLARRDFVEETHAMLTSYEPVRGQQLSIKHH